MAQMTTFLETAFLNFALRGIAPAKPTGLEVSFHTASPGETGSVGNEAALFASRLSPTFGNASARSVANNDAPTDTSLINATCTFWGIHLAGGGNEMIAYQEIQATPGGIAQPMTVAIGQPVRINVGNMVWSFPDTDKVFTDVIVNDFLSHMFGALTATARTATHVSLHTLEPNQATGAPEFGAGGYARSASLWDAPTAGPNDRQQVVNSSPLSYTNLQASDSPINWWGVWTADTGGEFIARHDQSDEIITDGSNASANAGVLSLLAG